MAVEHMDAKAKEAIAWLACLRKSLPAEEREGAQSATSAIESLQDELVRLRAQVRWLHGKAYRPKSEAVAPGQLAFELIDLLSGKGASGSADAEDDAGDSETEEVTFKRKKRPRRGRDLPRKIVECRLGESDKERQCACGCERPKTEIGFDAQERFVFQPAKVYILEERRYKYACRSCEDGILVAQAQLVPKPISGSMASSSLLAHLVVGKLCDGLPIERLAKRLRRHGVDLATSTLNAWMASVANLFEPFKELFLADLRRSSLISLDDTRMPAQKTRGDPAFPKPGMVRGRHWIYLGDISRVAFCEFTEDWKGSHPRAVLKGFSGDIQNDGYAGINPLFGPGKLAKRVGCNDHARRKFVHALEQRDSRAQPIIDVYQLLYKVESDAKAAGDDTQHWLARRQHASVPLWKRLRHSIDQVAPRVAKKSPLGKAITYFNRQHDTLAAFLDDARLPISNAHVEREMRMVAIYRKNSLFAGSPEAAKRHSTLLMIMLNCILCGANPYDYLVSVIDTISDRFPRARYAELLPQAWLEAREAKDQIAGDTRTNADFIDLV
ncbi:MAG: IS66 family transposase [Gammaproteobacteria bacterium]|nr:IS66 family transposase [Gammaproteobacteria bacterium]